uniref:Uncharacterized protein n=1 Tax=Anopheles atroparvus TaxID=41427 RepID=A0AAG5CP82_ANOAO
KGTYLGVIEGRLRRTLRLRGRIGQGENDGLVVVLAHRLQDFRRKRATDRGRSDQHGRFHLLHHVGKVLHHSVIFGIVRLVSAEPPLGPALRQQTIDVEHPDLVAGRLQLAALGLHGLHHQIGDTDGRLARPEKHERVLRDALAGEALRGEQAGHRHRCRALDVVVERAVRIAELVQEAERVVVAKVLELDERVLAVPLHDGLHELVDELVVLRALHARVPQADVQWILQQVLVVRADVDHDRQTLVRRNAGEGRVERELTDRNAHTAGTQIAQPENALTVRHDDRAHVRFRPVAQHIVHVPTVVDRHEQTARPPVDQPKLLARQPHRGRVHDRHHLLHVLRDQPEEQPLVAVLQIHQVQVLVQVLLVARDRDAAQFQLLLLRLEPGRLQPVDAEDLALLEREREPLVQPWVAQMVDALHHRRHDDVARHLMVVARLDGLDGGRRRRFGKRLLRRRGHHQRPQRIHGLFGIQSKTERKAINLENNDRNDYLMTPTELQRKATSVYK